LDPLFPLSDRPRFPPAPPIHAALACEQNSLLQALFHIEPFRRAVFAWRSAAEGAAGGGADADAGDAALTAAAAADDLGALPRALQSLFGRLALGLSPVAETRGLTCAFGWEGDEA
jgi:hypothetical protein